MNNTTWFKDEKFWQELYLYMFDTNRLAKTPVEAEGIIRLLDLRVNDEIVDFGCGTGRHLLELAKRGYEKSLGIDSSAYYISLAKADAKKQGVATRFEVGDMLDGTSAESFSVALSLFSSFGYYDAHEDNMRVLRNMCCSLKPGGKLLIDVRGKESFAYNFDGQGWAKNGDSFILTKRTALENFSKIENTWIIIKDGEEKEYTFTHWIYSAQELKGMLAEVGFSQMHVYGDFSGREYSPESKRLIIVAKKKS